MSISIVHTGLALHIIRHNCACLLFRSETLDVKAQRIRRFSGCAFTFTIGLFDTFVQHIATPKYQQLGLAISEDAK